VVLYGCESWSFTVREGKGLRMFENKELRKMFGLKGVEIIGVLRNPRTEEFHNLYFSSHISRMLKSKKIR
jgi:hypothetical protein